MIRVEKCSCGHSACHDYWLVGIGKFMQGSGFTETDANRIARLLNDDSGEPTHLDAGYLAWLHEQETP